MALYDDYIPAHLPVAPEVEAYRSDFDAIFNKFAAKPDAWHVDKEWADKFRKHREKLLLLAESGDALAQYSLGTLYMSGYLYTSVPEAINQQTQIEPEMTKWLLSAAKQGVIAALDNLLSVGVGEEADKLRDAYLASKDENGNGSYTKIMELVYGKHS
jgi:TPR repeat protein